MQNRRIILASGSPRRKELLAGMGVVFSVVPSDYDELLDETRLPEDVAKELGLGKALAVARKFPEAIVIGSDTIVALGDRQLGKPADEAEALDMLRLLAGREHAVITSVAVVCLAVGIQAVEVAVTKVFFKPWDEAAAKAYVATGDPLDKAGAYGIQSGTEGLIDHIEGDYETVVGLPTELVGKMLANTGLSYV